MNDLTERLFRIEAPQPASPPAGAFRFSLDGVPERDRPAMFREYFGREVLKYDLERLPDVAFHVDLKFQALPGLMMMSGRMHGSRNRRTAEAVAADGATDDVGMLVNLRGPHRVAYRHGEVVLGDGEAMLVSAGEVCSFTHRPPGDVLVLRAPRKELGALVTGVEDCYFRRIPSTNPALRLLTEYVKVAENSGIAAGRELQHLVVAHIYDLMALAIGATRDATQTAQGRGLRAARLQAIKEDIAGSLDQPDLSVAALAVRHGCTPRFVQRLFEAEGTTLTEYVLTKRLARAHRMLTDLRRADDKISTIALDFGFADVSYFNRAFRRHYGDTPSDVRAQATRRAG